MWPLALCLFVLSQTTAIPVLPLAQSGIERLNELKSVDVGNNGPRTFIVQVQQQQPQQLPTQQPQTREFPWPYPPVFERYLPSEVKQKLTQLYVDPTLSAEQRANQINAVFDELPQEIIQQLPLPAEYERLPADVYKRIFYIHVAPGFKWNERQQLIRDIVESLPEEQKQLMRTPRIGGPPPGFELVLSPTVYKELLTVHHNPRLNKEEKANLITQIMRQVPQDQIERLPLPAGMEELPAEFKQRARTLVYDYSIPQPVRAMRVRQFVQSLPEDIRPLLR